MLISLSDIDECAENSAVCSDICVNTNGSYYCTCPDNLVLGMDGVNCMGKLKTVLILSMISHQLPYKYV